MPQEFQDPANNYENQKRRMQSLSLQTYEQLQNKLSKLVVLSEDQAVPGLADGIEELIANIKHWPNEIYIGDVFKICFRLRALITKHRNSGYDLKSSIETIAEIESNFKKILPENKIDKDQAAAPTKIKIKANLLKRYRGLKNDVQESSFIRVWQLHQEKDDIEILKDNIISKITTIDNSAETIISNLNLMILDTTLPEITFTGLEKQAIYWNTYIDKYLKNLDFLRLMCKRITDNLVYKIDDGIMTPSHIQNFDNTTKLYLENWKIIHSNLEVFLNIDNVNNSGDQAESQILFRQYTDARYGEKLELILQESRKIMYTLENFSNK
jgi:hypothetical protein